MCVLCYCWWPHVCLLQESIQLITAHSGVPLLNDVMNNEYGDTHHIEAPEDSDININNEHYNIVKVQTCTVCVQCATQRWCIWYLSAILHQCQRICAKLYSLSDVDTFK